MSGRATDGHAQIPELTGLRGVAAILVVLSHLVGVTIFTGYPMFLGELGVMTFFSLSGFLMALIYLQKPFDRDAAVRYGTARFARIAPAYLFVIVAAYVIRNGIDPDFVYQITNHNVLRHLLFSGNAAVFWSIPPEVQFYVLFVVLWLAVASYARTRRPFLLTGVVGLCIVLIATRGYVPGTFVGSKLHFFLFGAVAGAVRARIARPLAPPASLAIVIGQTAVVVSMIALGLNVIDLGFHTNEDVYRSLANAIGAALVILVFSFPSTPSRWLLANPPMQLLGTCSFSIYLLHDPVIDWMRPMAAALGPASFTIAVIAAVVLLSYASYRLIEMPGGRLCRIVLRSVAPRMPASAKAVH